MSATHSAAVNATCTGAADTDDYDPLNFSCKIFIHTSLHFSYLLLLWISYNSTTRAGIQQEVSKQAQSTEPVIRPEIVSGSGGNFDSDSEVENQQGFVNYNDSDGRYFALIVHMCILY